VPDITMCTGRECPLKEHCYRYTAEPSEFRQSYFANPPYKELRGYYTCEHHWPIEHSPDKSIQRQLNL